LRNVLTPLVGKDVNLYEGFDLNMRTSIAALA
jgi:hypothetical protein